MFILNMTIRHEKIKSCIPTYYYSKVSDITIGKNAFPDYLTPNSSSSC